MLVIPKTIVHEIFEQLNKSLAEKVAQGNLIQHNLENGLGAERAFRSMLQDFLPLRYGVTKGKVVNPAGDMSGHCDVIIYDRLNCPVLYVDENENQIVPIEGVYSAIEVKVTLTKHTLTEAFNELRTVYALQPERPVRSENPLIDYRPPALYVVGFGGSQLKTLKRHFIDLNAKHEVLASFCSYSPESAGFPRLTGDTFLVNKVACLGRGTVHHMFNGIVQQRDWGKYTLGMFLVGILSDVKDISPSRFKILNYFNWLTAEYALLLEQADNTENPS
jgi:hypothetical protein